MALEMTWERIPCKRKNSPLGLRNLGNTCYLNSVLQCLTFTPPLAHFCVSHRHSSACVCSRNGGYGAGLCAFCLVEKRIARSLNHENPVDSPMLLNNFLHIFAKHFRQGTQEDAHEFLRYVIEACNDVCIKLSKSKQPNGAKANREPNSIIKDIFGGVLQSQVKCLSCGAESNKMDEIKDISLDVLHSQSLKEAFSCFFQAEKLDGSNKYNCEKCKKLSAARKQMSIFQAPNVLVIQLKRFENIYGGKIDRNITFEEHLSLSGYMCRASQVFCAIFLKLDGILTLKVSAMICHNADSCDAKPEYSLFGTIVHAGFTQDSGHYYAYVKDASGRWHCCNDAHISLATLKEVLSEKVYILFYIRNSQRSRGKDIGCCNGTVPLKHYRTAVDENAHKTLNKNDTEEHETYAKISTLNNQTGDSCCNGFSGLRKDIPSQKNQTAAACQSEDKRIHLLPTKTTFLESVTHESSNSSLGGGRDLKDNSAKPVFSDVKFSEANGCKRMSGSAEAAKNDSSNLVSDAQTCLYTKKFVTDGHHGSIQESVQKRPREVTSLLLQRSDVTTQNNVRQRNAKSPVEVEANGSEISSEDNLKQKLCLEANQLLQSCGWCDDVKEMMRERKRIRSDQSGDGRVPARALLVHDVRERGIQLIPDSVKNRLVEQLRSFFEERH